MCFQSSECKSAINLGLSLSTVQVDHACHHSPSQGHLQGQKEEDGHLICTKLVAEDYIDDDNDEAEGVQSQRRWVYVKVNMDGVVIGRKVCVIGQSNYSTLALQLDDMFGGQCTNNNGLKLFEAESEFSLIYKDPKENWRFVGDVPWKEFIETVKRIRIASKVLNIRNANGNRQGKSSNLSLMKNATT